VCTRFWWRKLREREDLLEGERVTLQWILKECEGWGGVDGIYLTQVRGRSRAHGKAVMNRQVPKSRGTAGFRGRGWLFG